MTHIMSMTIGSADKACPVVENASTNRVGARDDNHGTPEGVLSGSEPAEL